MLAVTRVLVLIEWLIRPGIRTNWEVEPDGIENVPELTPFTIFNNPDPNVVYPEAPNPL